MNTGRTTTAVGTIWGWLVFAAVYPLAMLAAAVYAMRGAPDYPQ